MECSDHNRLYSYHHCSIWTVLLYLVYIVPLYLAIPEKNPNSGGCRYTFLEFPPLEFSGFTLSTFKNSGENKLSPLGVCRIV